MEIISTVILDYMKTNYLIMLLIMIGVCCSFIKYFPIARPQKEIAKCSYIEMKVRINKLRKSLQLNDSKLNYDLIEKNFVSVIVDSIIPYWYGTPWDFNGITQEPGKGAIACGYFISTVMRDAGFNVNRVKLGQAASQTIIRHFAEQKTIKIFYDKPLDSTLSYVLSCGKGLFIVGLDYHVGFLYNDGNSIWFIHSKWIDPKAVVKEAASSSGILYYSRYRIVGKVSSNKRLLRLWLEE